MTASSPTASSTGLASLRKALGFKPDQQELLLKRLGHAFNRAMNAYVPWARYAETGKLPPAMADKLFDIEWFELGGNRIYKLIHGQCSLAALLETDVLQEVDKFEARATEYVEFCQGLGSPESVVPAAACSDTCEQPSQPAVTA